jgi:undecaprenyl-diphosphatase
MAQILQAILLGIVQGLTEFIPVSSSAHLVVVPWLIEPITGISDFGLSFDLALHLGTLIALLFFFWHDWVRYISAGVASLRDRAIAGDHDRLLAWLLVIGTIPGAIAGFLGDSFIESVFHQPGAGHAAAAMLGIAILMIIMAILMWLAERMAQHIRGMDQIDLRDAILVGLAQALAILPGVSRAGSTITMGLGVGLQRPAAARFSFLLGTPIIAGAGLKKMYDALKSGLLAQDAAIFIAGFIAAAIVGYFCIRILLGFLQKHTVMIFVYYRLVVGFLIVLFVLLGYNL